MARDETDIAIDEMRAERGILVTRRTCDDYYHRWRGVKVYADRRLKQECDRCGITRIAPYLA